MGLWARQLGRSLDSGGGGLQSPLSDDFSALGDPHTPDSLKITVADSGELLDVTIDKIHFLAPLECHGRSRQCHSRTGLGARPVWLGLRTSLEALGQSKIACPDPLGRNRPPQSPGTRRSPSMFAHRILSIHRSSSRRSSSTLISWCRATLFRMLDSVLILMGLCRGITS